MIVARSNSLDVAAGTDSPAEDERPKTFAEFLQLLQSFGIPFMQVGGPRFPVNRFLAVVDAPVFVPAADQQASVEDEDPMAWINDARRRRRRNRRMNRRVN